MILNRPRILNPHSLWATDMIERSESNENILDHPAISGCYLFPQNRSIDSPFMVRVRGVELVCYRRIIGPDRFTQVRFHGIREAVADYVPWMAQELAALGLKSLFVEYRGDGDSTGKAQLVAMLRWRLAGMGRGTWGHGSHLCRS
jgi:hypothetical protein